METTQNAKFRISIKRDILRAALIFAGDKDIRYYLNGACLHVGPAGDARMVACDGHRLAVFTMEDQAGAVPGEYLIPRDALKAIKKAARYQAADVLLDIDGERFTIREPYENGDILAGSKLLDGKFPDWERVLPDPATMDGTPGNYNPDYLADIKKGLVMLGDKNGLFYLHQNGRDNSALVVRGDLGFLCVVMPIRSDKPELTSLAEFRPRFMPRAIVETAAGGQGFPCDPLQDTGDKRRAPGVVDPDSAADIDAFNEKTAKMKSAPDSKRTILETGFYARDVKTPINLIHATAGMECAGAGMRQTPEKFGAIFDHGGTNSGTWYKTEAEARAEFERITTPSTQPAADDAEYLEYMASMAAPALQAAA